MANVPRKEFLKIEVHRKSLHHNGSKFQEYKQTILFSLLMSPLAVLIQIHLSCFFVIPQLLTNQLLVNMCMGLTHVVW